MTPLLLLTACAAGGPGGAGADPGDTAATDATANAGAGGEADEATGTPTHWSIAGTLTLAGGALVAEDTALAMEIVDATLGVRVCSVALDPSAAVPLAADEAVATPRGAWGPLAASPSGCTDAVPARLALALGDVPDDVRAEASASPDGALGAWASVDGAPSVAFGLAAPPETDGTGEGLADGTWVLTPVYGWALAGEALRRGQPPPPPQDGSTTR